MRQLQKRPRPLAFYLIALCLALTVPTLSVAGLMTWRFAQSEKARLENDVDDINRGAVDDIERLQSADMAMLRTLATTPALRDGDFESFKAQAQALIDTHFHGAHIILYSRDGFHTLLDVGLGVKADRLPPPIAVLGRNISDLDRGGSFGDSSYAITVPVIVGGATRFHLSARMPLSRLASIVREQHVAPGHYVSVIDRNGIILARSSDNEAQFGRKIPGVDGNAPHHFSWSGVNPQGVSVYGVYRRLNFGWGVTTGVSQQILHAPLRASLRWLAMLAAIMIAVSLAAAWLIARVMARAVQTLERKAGKLDDGTAVEATETAVAEVNTIGRAMAAASTRMRDQAAALQAANVELEHRVAQRTCELAEKTSLLETTLAHMDQGLIVTDAGHRIQLWNARSAELLGLPRDVLRTGANISETIGFQLRRGDFGAMPEDVAIMYSTDLIAGRTLVHERERADGSVLEVRSVPMADGRLVRTYTDVTLRKHAERHLRHLARHDPLTGLPNRVLLRERLEQAAQQSQRQQRGFAVLSLDLDRFKEVNDLHGHAVGDELLVDIAQRLKSILRMEDTVARLGGDEFTIIQTAPGTDSDILDFAERILALIAQPFRVGETAFDIGVSIGIARGAPGATPEDMLKRADDALYRAKRRGRNCFCFHEPEPALRRTA